MAKRTEIVKFLNEYLDVKNIPDSSANGLQIEGKEEVKSITFAVDACLEAFENATDTDMIIVHHGMFWDKIGPITKDTYSRIKVLMDNDMSLLAYHAPLDKHPVVGNNAQILKNFNIVKKSEFGHHDGVFWGYVGKMEKSLTLPQMSKKVQDEIGDHVVLNFGKKMVQKVACVSGGAAFAIPEAAKKADILIIGEMKHSFFHIAKELKINVISAGHYQTEVFGLMALKKLIEKKFKVKCNFLDIPTGY